MLVRPCLGLLPFVPTFLSSAYHEINVTFSLYHPAPTDNEFEIYIIPVHHETSTVIGLTSNGAPSIAFVSKYKYDHVRIIRDLYEKVNILGYTKSRCRRLLVRY